MARDAIERSTVIEAPINIVWEIVSQPEHIGQWWSDKAQIDLRPGGKGLIEWTGEITGNVGQATLTVEAIEPPTRFAFRWVSPDNSSPEPGNSVLVEFTLRAIDDDHTTLTVAESGISALDWPAEKKAAYAAEHTNGWEFFLDRIVAHAAKVLTAAGMR